MNEKIRLQVIHAIDGRIINGEKWLSDQAEFIKDNFESFFLNISEDYFKITKMVAMLRQMKADFMDTPAGEERQFFESAVDHCLKQLTERPLTKSSTNRVVNYAFMLEKEVEQSMLAFYKEMIKLVDRESRRLSL